MGVSFDDERIDDLARRGTHWTTIILEEQADGGWLATQRGIDVEGRGDTAVEAATNYCRAIEEGPDGRS